MNYSKNTNLATQPISNHVNVSSITDIVRKLVQTDDKYDRNVTNSHSNRICNSNVTANMLSSNISNRLKLFTKYSRRYQNVFHNTMLWSDKRAAE